MGLILFLGLWLLVPLAELAVIAGLCFANHTNKRKIEELTKELAVKTRLVSLLQTEAGKGSEGCLEVKEKADLWPDEETVIFGQEKAGVKGEETKPEGQEIEPEGQEIKSEEWETEPIKWEIKPGISHSKQSKGGTIEKGGTVALMIGMVFVVLAGLVFATTAWSVLSDAAKVFLVFAFGILFFSVSFLSEKQLHLHRTGNGLYVLGSIFMFLSVLAAGYFRLLGPRYVFVGQNRWRVLWVGSMVTVGLLFLGIKRFHDWIYTQTCFWGMSVSMTFLLLACGIYQGILWSSSMMVYAFFLVLGGMAFRLTCGKSAKWPWKHGTWFIAHRNKTSQQSGMCQTDQESGFWPDGTLAFDRKTSKEGTFKNVETIGARALLLQGFLQFAPIHFFVFVIPVIFYGVMGGLFRISRWICWQEVLALTAAAAGLVLAPWMFFKHGERQKEREMLFSLIVAILIHNLAAWIFQDHVLFWLLGAQTGLFLWFLAGQNEKFREITGVRTRLGDQISTLFLILDNGILGGRTLFLGMFASRQTLWTQGQNFLGVLAGSIMLAVVVFVWEKRSKRAKKIIPFLLWYITFYPLKGWLKCVFWGNLCPFLSVSLGQMALDWISRGILEFFLLIGLVLWEKKRNKGYGVPILVLGTISSLIYFSPNQASFPFFLVLAVYLLTETMTERKGSAAYRGAVFYGMAGVYVWMIPLEADCDIWRVMALVWTYMAGLAGRERFCKNEPEEKERHIYWDIMGCVLTGIAMGKVYGNYRLNVLGVLLCLVVAAGFYGMFYWGKRMWTHLAVSVILLPLPFVMAHRYQWSSEMMYGIVGGSLLVTGVLARSRYKIVEKTLETEGIWRVDWYHVLSVIWLAPMAVLSDDSYCRFGYWMLLFLYFLQYKAVEKWSGVAKTGAGLMLVFAYWSQPFVEFLPLVKTEFRLLPVVLFLIGLGLGKNQKERFPWSEKALKRVQKAGFAFCLLILWVDAWIQKDVANALILEGISLGIFLWGAAKENSFWVRMGATVLVSVALYMTKGFWFSLPWWVYLLATGIGLIVYGAVREGRMGTDRQKEGGREFFRLLRSVFKKM